MFVCKVVVDADNDAKGCKGVNDDDVAVVIDDLNVDVDNRLSRSGTTRSKVKPVHSWAQIYLERMLSILV